MMSDTLAPQPGSEDLQISDLAEQIKQALKEAARRNNRTLQEEAEHIIKTHLTVTDEHR